MTDKETQALFVEITEVKGILIGLTNSDTGLLPAMKEQLKLINASVEKHGQAIVAINTRCQERQDCASKDTRKYLAIGAGIGAGITGVGEGIKRWLLGG